MLTVSVQWLNRTGRSPWELPHWTTASFDSVTTWTGVTQWFQVANYVQANTQLNHIFIL